MNLRPILEGVKGIDVIGIQIRVLVAVTLIPIILFGQRELSNEDVLKLAKAGISEDVIVSTIQQSPGKYSTGPDELIALKAAGVSDKAIAAMVNKKTEAPAGANRASAGPTVANFTLNDATPIKLRLSRTLSSADAKVGDSVDLEVLEDIKVDDVLVIARGGTAIATITEAQAKRRMARGGKLNVNIDYVRLTNGEKVALRAVKETKGGGHTGAMTGAMVATGIIFFPAAPLFLFMHGKDTVIPKGTEITAYINGDIKLERDKFKTN